jgi:hypothetical protein
VRASPLFQSSYQQIHQSAVALLEIEGHPESTGQLQRDESVCHAAKSANGVDFLRLRKGVRCQHRVNDQEDIGSYLLPQRIVGSRGAETSHIQTRMLFGHIPVGTGDGQ